MSTPWRLGLFYALMFLGTGASLPYLPVWLRAEGMGGAAIGAVLSAPYLARLLAGPAAALWADSFNQRRTSLLFLGAIAAVASSTMLLTDSPAAHAVGWFVTGTAAMAMLPLMDVLTLRLSRREGFDYGRPRAMGSAAFILANLALGAMLTRWSPDLVIVWIALAATGTVLTARVLLPPEPIHEEGEPLGRSERWRGLKTLLKSRLFMLAIVSSGMIQAAHAFHYGFSSLIWSGQGIDKATIGALWATGVAAEIVLLWFMEPWRERMGPVRLLLLGGAASVVRWTIAAFMPPAAVLFPLQILHALTFAAGFTGALQLVHRICPPQAASAAQTLNASLSGGFFIGAATLVCGPLFDEVGARGYLAMTAMSLVGLVGVTMLARALNPTATPAGARS